MFLIVFKSLQILWIPISEPETWGFPKYSGVREHVSPGSIPSAPVTEICLTGSNDAKKPGSLHVLPVQQGGWVGSNLCYIFSWDVLILQQVNILLENDCDGKFPDLSPALIWNASLNRMDSEQNPGGLDHSGWSGHIMQQGMGFHGPENITKYTETHQLPGTKETWPLPPLGVREVPA